MAAQPTRAVTIYDPLSTIHYPRRSCRHYTPRAMFILLTNDDGIHAPGLVALWRELTKLGKVQVVAPETVQSATGHGITVATPLLTNRVAIEGALTGTAVDGRPADCVKLA